MLRIAYIADTRRERPKRLTPQQQLHQEALITLAARKIHDREKARRMFAQERAEIEKLEKKYNINH